MIACFSRLRDSQAERLFSSELLEEKLLARKPAIGF